MSEDPLAGQSFRTRREAEVAARLIGCEGVHQTEEGWMVCRSQEELDALLSGGVRAYRRLRREEKVLGRLIRSAAPSKRKLRRVPVNPKAEDRDGDGLVQEGTTAQRSAKKPSVPTPKKRVRKPPKPAIDKNVNEVKRYEPDGEPVEVDDELRILDGAIKRAGGIGRARTRNEGPLPEVVRRMSLMRKKVYRRYGKLETVQDMESALRRAFPNAEVNISALAGDLDESPVLAGVRLKPKAGTNAQAVENVGGTDERTLQTMRGVTIGLLQKALDDPDTASRVGGIIPIANSSDYLGVQGTGIIHPIRNNIILGFGFSRVGEHVDDYLAISKDSTNYLSQLRNIDRNQGTESAYGMSFRALTDSDAEASGAYVAFHEWAHAAGVATVVDDLPDTYFDLVKQYVDTGKVDLTLADGPSSTMLIRAQFANRDLQVEIENVIKKYGADPASQDSWKKVLSLWGYGNVDPSDEASMGKVMRAAAARLAFAVTVDEILEKRVQSTVSKEEWSTMGKVSGYASRSKEEAVAEFMALQALHPDFVQARFGQILDNEEIIKRLK